MFVIRLTKTNMISLRSNDVCLPIIGKARGEALSTRKLPTNRDVLQRFAFFIRVDKSTRLQSVNRTCAEIVALWDKIAGQTCKSYTCYNSLKTIKRKLNK